MMTYLNSSLVEENKNYENRLTSSIEKSEIKEIAHMRQMIWYQHDFMMLVQTTKLFIPYEKSRLDHKAWSADLQSQV